MSNKNYRDITITVRKYNFGGYSEVLGKHSVEDLSEVSTTCAAQACRQKQAKKAKAEKRKNRKSLSEYIMEKLFRDTEEA